MEVWAAVFAIRMKTMAQKVDAKKAMKPVATAISRLANHPISPSGMPKRLPVVGALGCAGIGEDCVIRLE